VDPYPRGPDWMPITPKTGSLFHAESHTCTIRHSGLRRASVDHESSARSGSRIRGCQPEDVRILIDTLMTAHGIYPRCRRALRDYHYEA
jgi:hypothetical protein